MSTFRRFCFGWRNPILTVALGAAAVASLACGCTVPAAGNVLPSQSARVAFQSPCAQNAIECTSSWPTAIVTVLAVEGQTVTLTNTGFLVEASPAATSVSVQFMGDASTLGTGATMLSYSWTSSAVEDDPCVLTPGEEFSSEANPLVNLATGFHYIRLTVENDIVRELVESEACGVFGTDVPSFDFVELEIEVRN